jgi:hypothetical protein
VEPQEIDSALDELENRLDRLRSLYEQYFMGIEKIEPTVPRKDVDRRFWILRRTQIRNTARRFRLQTLVQRYNTFQQHWTRICREIENGTYVRHLLKAKKNLGAEPKTWAAKKRLGLLRRDRATDSEAPAAGEATASPSVPPSAPPSVQGGNGAAAPAPIFAARERPGASMPPRASSIPRPSQDELSPLDLDLDDAPTLQPPRPPSTVAKAPAKPPIPMRLDATGTARPGGSLPRPAVLAPQATPEATAAKSAVPLPTPTKSAIPVPGTSLPKPGSAPGVAARAPTAPAPPGTPVAPTRARPPFPSSSTEAGTGEPRPPLPSVADNAGSLRPPIPRPASLMPKPPAAPPTPQRTAAPTPAARAPAAISANAAQKPAPVAANAAPKPVLSRSEEKPATAGGAQRPAPAGLSDERVAQLHAELNAARRQLNQSSSSVSLDALAKSLRDTETKLKGQHGGRSVDFQVVIKDGKPIVKPVVRR